MRIDVAALEVGQVIRATFSEPIDSLTEDVVFDVPVTGDVEVVRDRTTVRLSGLLVTSTPLSCGRCLTAFRQPLRAQLDEEFLMEPPPQKAGVPGKFASANFWGGKAGGAGQRVLGAEDFILPLGSDLVLDVNEVIRQHLLLTLPMVPLCRPDCRGLCPVCGANRNEVECGHQPAQVDPRLAPLIELRDRLPEE